MSEYDDSVLSIDAWRAIRNDIGLVLHWAKYDQTVRDCLRLALDALDTEPTER